MQAPPFRLRVARWLDGDHLGTSGWALAGATWSGTIIATHAFPPGDTLRHMAASDCPCGPRLENLMELEAPEDDDVVPRFTHRMAALRQALPDLTPEP